MRTCWDGNEPWPLCDPDPEPDKPEGGKDLRLELLDERLPDFLLAFLTLMALAGTTACCSGDVEDTCREESSGLCSIGTKADAISLIVGMTQELLVPKVMLCKQKGLCYQLKYTVRMHPKMQAPT